MVRRDQLTAAATSSLTLADMVLGDIPAVLLGNVAEQKTCQHGSVGAHILWRGGVASEDNSLKTDSLPPRPHTGTPDLKKSIVFML